MASVVVSSEENQEGCGQKSGWIKKHRIKGKLRSIDCSHQNLIKKHGIKRKVSGLNQEG